MSEIANLVIQAQNMGVKIYLQGSQLKLDMPWSIGSIPDPVRYILAELKKRQGEVLAYLDPEQEKHWQAVLTNSYFLYYPKGNGEFEPLRPLHDILEQLKSQGARLSKMVSRFDQGKIIKLKLEMGSIPWPDWNMIQAEVLPKYWDQLTWLLTLSAMGAAREYVDLAVDFPPEWIGDTLGKHAARIAELRREIIEEMAEKNQRSGLYFEVGPGQKYCLVPCKTGRKLTEVTPEEYILVAEAQEAGMLPPGPEGARSALKWWNEGEV
jgi:hypothetical protein